MEPKETHNTIEELLSAAYDGEVSEEEHAQAEAALDSLEWASHAAFLGLLKDSARFDPIEVPATLSERIALATYARPTLWSRITAALRPAPMRYAAGGLVLSGLAAIGLVMLRPAQNPVPLPAASTNPNTVAIGKPSVEPDVVQPTPVATPKAVAPTPAPVIPTVPDSVEKPAPVIEDRNENRVPVVTSTVVAKHQPTRAELPTAPKATPAPAKKASALAPARLAEPVADAVPVAMETPRPGAVDTGEPKDITEGTSVIAEPRSVTIASTQGAAEGDPGEIHPTPVKANPNGIMKISLNQTREKLNGLTGQATVGGASGSRMAVVTDNEKR